MRNCKLPGGNMTVPPLAPSVAKAWGQRGVARSRAVADSAIGRDDHEWQRGETCLEVVAPQRRCLKPAGAGMFAYKRRRIGNGAEVRHIDNADAATHARTGSRMSVVIGIVSSVRSEVGGNRNTAPPRRICRTPDISVSAPAVS